MLLMSLTLASRIWWDPSPEGQRKEVATAETRLEPAPPEASSSQKRATRPELGRKGFHRRWAEQPHLSGLGTLRFQPSRWFYRPSVLCLSHAAESFMPSSVSPASW